MNRRITSNKTYRVGGRWEVRQEPTGAWVARDNLIPSDRRYFHTLTEALRELRRGHPR